MDNKSNLRFMITAYLLTGNATIFLDTVVTSAQRNAVTNGIATSYKPTATHYNILSKIHCIKLISAMSQ